MKKFGLFISDIVIFYLALAITIFLRYPHNFSPNWNLHVPPFTIIFIIWMLVFYIANLFDFNTLRNNLDFYNRLFRALAASTTISILFFYIFPYFRIAPKTNLLIFVSIAIGLETLSRWMLNRAFAAGVKKQVLLVGLNEQTLELIKFIRENPQLGFRVDHVIDTDETTTSLKDEFKLYATISGSGDMNQTIKDNKIDIAVISPEAYQDQEIIQTFYKSLERQIKFYNLSSFFEQITQRVPLGAINQTWFLDNFNNGSSKMYEASKRVVDIICGIILGLLSLLLYPFVILLMLFDEGNGIWSVQERVGQGGKIIEVYKFRTMLIANDKGAWEKGQNRVTRIGNFLRKTRLDELPQLWNVLMGSLSLIGPRPEFPSAVDKYRKLIPYYDVRHLVKPGLSGWAQVYHRNHPHHGVDVNETKNKLSYDLYYIKNRSFILDLEIILNTARIALAQAGR